MRKVDKRWLVVGGVTLSSLAGLFWLANMIVPRTLVSLTRAEVVGSVSFGDSIMIGEKILAKADGVDTCKVNIFLTDKDGRGVAGKRVVLEGVEGLTVGGGEVSNVEGKVTFELASQKEGQFKLKAMVEGVPMGRELTVTFRN